MTTDTLTPGAPQPGIFYGREKCERKVCYHTAQAEYALRNKHMCEVLRHEVCREMWAKQLDAELPLYGAL